jgi:tetratricopeptide (TPR) repeat protein
MLKLFSRKPKTDPALAAYPAALAELLTFGEPDDQDYESWAGQLDGYVPDLLRMVLDEDLNQRDQDDPAVWAPLHALRVLGVLGPVEVAEPLIACASFGDDWIVDELPQVYASIGPGAIPVLHQALYDPTLDPFKRSVTANALTAIARQHASARNEVVTLLAAFLDRPEADKSADEEELSAFVICHLTDLGDLAAYPAIRRAFDEDRVALHIVGLDEVEHDLGLQPRQDLDEMLEERDSQPGVQLGLRCKACGRERIHTFARVYYDLGTYEDEAKRTKYDPLIIPQRVVCPKCGAVDQYELGIQGTLTLTASLLARRPRKGAISLSDGILFVSFDTRWGLMHPLEAVERYQLELARRPDDDSLHLGLGNILRTLGRLDEAEHEYRQALALNEENIDAWELRAQLAGERGEFAEAIRCWQEVWRLAAFAPLTGEERTALVEMAARSLDQLNRGEIPQFVPETSERRPTAQAWRVPQRAKPASSAVPQVGRNQPCPCGSGRKYKHCHGRSGA